MATVAAASREASDTIFIVCHTSEDAETQAVRAQQMYEADGRTATLHGTVVHGDGGARILMVPYDALCVFGFSKKDVIVFDRCPRDCPIRLLEEA